MGLCPSRPGYPWAWGSFLTGCREELLGLGGLMGLELSYPHPGGRREGQPEALLPGPPETHQVGGGVGLSPGDLKSPRSHRVRQWDFLPSA